MLRSLRRLVLGEEKEVAEQPPIASFMRRTTPSDPEQVSSTVRSPVINPWEHMLKTAADIIAQAADIGADESLDLLEVPPDPALGDLATTVAFALAKHLRRSPVQIAAEVAERVKTAIDAEPLFERVEVKGPYINLFLDRAVVARFVINAISETGPSYGRTRDFEGKRALVEFPAVNPSKPWHIGHARNAVLGDTLCNVLEMVGFEVIRLDYINDLGLQIAQLTWRLMDGDLQPEKGEKYDHFLGRVYVDIQRDFESDPAVERAVREVARQLEIPDSDEARFSEKMVSECLKAQCQTAYRLGIYHDYQVWESSIAHSGLLDIAKKMILKCPSVMILQEGEKAGCIVAKLDDLEEFKGMKDPYKVLFRSDGTRTYTGADLAFQMWKHQIIEDPFRYVEFEVQPNGKPVYRTTLEGHRHDLGKVDLVFNVIAAAQAHPQRLIYNILELLGYKRESENSHHIAYEFVGLEDTEFSGRKGTWIGYTVDDVLDRAEEIARIEVEKRNPDASDEFKNRVAGQVAVGALRYFMLNASPDRKITFRWDSVLDFEGDTGPYLQYSYARAQRILERAGDEGEGGDATLLVTPYEFALVKALSRFPYEVVQVVRGLKKEVRGTAFSSNRLTEYAFEIATLFSKFYDNCPVLKADGDLRRARLALVRAFRDTIRNCLQMLGIPVIERM